MKLVNISNSWLLGIIGAVVALATSAILITVWSRPSRMQPLDEMSLTFEAVPLWAGEPPRASETALPEPASALLLYLDVSYPMGGFLPFEGAEQDFSSLRTVSQLVADHLVRTYGSPAVRLQWRGVAQALSELEPSPKIERSLFAGSESKLDLAIGEMVQVLASGRAEAVALISDLLATGALTGPLAVAKELEDWLRTDAVRRGDLDIGLLGVRASYWGVTSGSCPERGGLGCWFSERRPGFRRLEELAEMPFYVLVLGRGRREVDRIGRSIQDDAERLGLEVRWELLSSASRPLRGEFSCKASKWAGESGRSLPQFALFRENDGRFMCVRDEPVELSCHLESDQSPLVPVRTEVSSPAIEASVLGERVVLLVDCGALREHPPDSDVELELIARAPAPPASAWDDWSGESDELAEFLGRTLQLRYFVEEVRLLPDQYSVDLPPLLRIERP